MSFANRGNGRRANRQFAVQKIRMRNSAHVPELQENMAAGLMRGVGNQFPAGNVGVGENTWCANPTRTLRRDCRGFGHDQSRSGTLFIVLSDKFIG